MSELKKMYITFGSKHQHRVNGNLLDKESVAVFQCRTGLEGMKMAVDYFSDKFAFAYFDTEWKSEDIAYYSRGYVMLPQAPEGEAK